MRATSDGPHHAFHSKPGGRGRSAGAAGPRRGLRLPCPSARCGRAGARRRRGVVRRPRRGERPRLRPRHRHDRTLLPAGDQRRRRGVPRLRQRRRPRRAARAGRRPRSRVGRCGAGAGRNAAHGPAVPQRPRGPRRRNAHAPIHRRDGGERHRDPRLRAGGGERRHRQRRLARPLPHGVRAQPDVPQRPGRDVHGRLRGVGHGQPRHLGRLRDLFRCRPRRLAGPVRRQLPDLHRRDAPPLLPRLRAGGLLQPRALPSAAGTASTATGATAPSRRPRPRPGWRTSSARPSAPPPRTSTATDGSTSSSPTTSRRTSSG